MQRALRGSLVAFLAGMAVAYGLVGLDRWAKGPTLKVQPTEIFELDVEDLGVQTLTYADIERDREELKRLRRRLTLARAGEAPEPARRPPEPAPSPEEPEEGSADRSPASPNDTSRAEASRKNLGNLFAKIFSQPVIQDLVDSQVKREAGELAAVLDLSEEQQAEVEQALRVRKKALRPRLGREEPTPPPKKTLEEEFQAIFTPEQFQTYETYTEKKKALRGQPALERDLFELTWRLDLTDAQKPLVREVLREHGEKAGKLSPASDLAGTATPGERLQSHIAERQALNRETAESMKGILDEDQLAGFRTYQEEKDAETRLLQRLISEEKPAGGTPPRP